MKKYILDDLTLMHGFLDVDIEGILYDLHNDYYCHKISLQHSCVLVFNFRSITNNSLLNIVFDGCAIESIDMSLVLLIENGLTLDDFYRGRLEKDGKVIEVTPDGSKIFYISFDEEVSMTIVSRETYLEY